MNLTLPEEPCNKGVQTDPLVLNHAFLEELGTERFSRRSFLQKELVLHSHGQTIKEIMQVRFLRLGRTVDLVVYPGSQEECEFLVQLA